MKRFRETLIFKDNRYHVTWPWKTDIPELPTNRQLATGRLRSLVTRLQARPETMKKYNDIIEDQLDKNIIEKVGRTKSHGILHYIPHHAVIKPDRSTTKVRIVYDASAKSKPENKSLNEMMYRGPVMLHDLCGMLLRFRLHTIGIVADIEKAFLQVSLQPSERDATRFLWLKNVELPAIDSNIQEFRFCRVPFGVISSPFLLGATVDYHLDSYDSDVARLLKRDIYMDNVITGAKSTEESVLLYDISKRIFSEANTDCDKDIDNHYIEDTTNETAEEIQCKEEQVGGTLTSSQADVQEIVTVPNHPPFGIDIEEYSSAKKLLRVTAYASRFVRKLQGKKYAEKQLTTEEIEQAEQMWIKHTQRNNFGEVLTSLKLNTKNNLKQQLGIYMDDEGVLRCKGRLENACLTESSRVPILLPSHNRFTSLMIERVHGQYLHCGVSQTLSMVRYRFWIPRGRAIVKKVLNSCFVCRKLEGGHYKMPNMPPLPKPRVSEATPFSNTGVDYLGPLIVKEGEVKKVWFCLFTCMITRAVHLEIAFDMSTIAFLNCLVRFISCRGTPRTIVSDNAKHFKLANETLNQVWDEVITSEEVQGYVSNAGIRWQFIVQLAPWMGGFYERLVGLIKRALRKVLGRNLLTSDNLNTIVKQIEAVVNSRPLVYVGDDINSTVTITPAHFLSLNPRTGVPEIVETDDESYKSQENSSTNLLTIWKKGQKLLENFWKIWRDEYLQSLRERTQTVLRSKRPQTNFVPQEGDVVLIKEQLPRGNWRMGKIERLVKSADGQIRSAHVLTRNGKLLGRPICLLYPIETTKTATISQEIQKPVNNENPKVPRRKSALKAKELIKQCLKE